MALYVKAVEHGSFSKAAPREGVPVSTVSRKISDLEKALGGGSWNARPANCA